MHVRKPLRTFSKKGCTTMLLDQIAWSDCIVFILFLIPQLPLRVGLVATIKCGLKALPFICMPQCLLHATTPSEHTLQSSSFPTSCSANVTSFVARTSLHSSSTPPFSRTWSSGSCDMHSPKSPPQLEKSSSLSPSRCHSSTSASCGTDTGVVQSIGKKSTVRTSPGYGSSETRRSHRI